ncbi:hypothetical protein [Bartonella sp. ML70XJBT.G]|uniref:hypothetical protein n=1 Tax=Bartonella sp. ML70XJBT.G TaxID=3019093 RepID=UPI0023601790|nr:hypothetical protein [Bartonella sp. ML70XJBT.G]
MKQILRLLSCTALLVIIGCQFNKPPPGYFMVWEKSGANQLEVKKALLECGMPAPYDVFPENRNLSNNAIGTIEACMIQAGFRDKVGGGTMCENHKAENLPICRPGAVIPQRSVKKRLNSPFCKKHPEQYECYP